MSQRNSTEVPFYKVRVLQVNSVGKRTNLSTVIERLKGEIQSLVGVTRVYDYENDEASNIVHLYLANAIEFEQLVQLQSLLVDGRIAKINSPDIVATSAIYSIPFEDFDPANTVPHPWSINLNHLPVSPNDSTSDLLSILYEFESRFTVTGVVIAYDQHRKQTRNTGFVIVNKLQVAQSLIGTTVHLKDRHVEIKAVNAAPLLLSRRTLNELKKTESTPDGKLRFSTTVAAENWMSTIIQDKVPRDLPESLALPLHTERPRLNNVRQPPPHRTPSPQRHRHNSSSKRPRRTSPRSRRGIASPISKRRRSGSDRNRHHRDVKNRHRN